MNRSQFTEVLIRLAKSIYMSNFYEEGITYNRNDTKLIKDREYDKQNMNEMRVHIAVGFLENPFRRWTENVKKIKTTPKIDRKYDLWV